MTISQALKVFSLSSIEQTNLEDLKKIYRKLALQRHPDKSGGSSLEFVELREAYLLLMTKLNKDNSSKINRSHLKKTDESDLKELSKDEILVKYYKDTNDLQDQVNSYQLVTANQIKALENIKHRAQDILTRFEEKKQELRSELDKNLMDLEKKINPGLLTRIFSIFRPRITEEQFWKLYNIEVQSYARKDADLDVEFFKEMLGNYGSGLNEIADAITEL